ncbi:hypothetical protein Tco_0866825 [Tanacetum coccineum]
MCSLLLLLKMVRMLSWIKSRGRNVKSSQEQWDSLEAKYMVEDASSKKFLVSNFTNCKITDSRLVMEQYNELLGIPGRFVDLSLCVGFVFTVSGIKSIRRIKDAQYGVLGFLGFLVKSRHRYAVSSLQDTMYWMSEQ